ncbi:MAG: hypothetical protein O2894_07475 [Planctomycetota bacterium]|nr:hypothetical protein [Planctomycetota bacterium]
MPRFPTILSQLVIALIVVAGYHLLVHDVQSTTCPLGPAPASEPATEERTELVQLLAGSAVYASDAYDANALQAIVERAGLALELSTQDVVLPALHAHLHALRENLEAAVRALDEGAGPAERFRYRTIAVQQHGRFQAELGRTLPRESVLALFRAAPPLLPPAPALGATR